MKKIIDCFLLTTLIVMSSFSFISCNEENKENPEQPEEIPAAEIKLNGEESDASSISFSVQVDHAIDFAFLVKEGEMETLPEAASLFTEDNTHPAEAAGSFTVEDLKAQTLYTVIASARNEENKCSEVVKLQMTTAELCTFEIKVTETLPSLIKADIACSEATVKFITLVIPSADLKDLSDTEANDLILKKLKQQNPDKNLKEILGELYRTDFVKTTFTELLPNTQYTIVAYAIDEAGQLLSNIARKETATSPLKVSDLTFDIQNPYTFDYTTITVTPSNLEEKYVYVFGEMSAAPEGAETAEDFANAYVKENRERLDLGKEMFTGVITNEYVLTPVTEYYILAFAYEYGITSKIELIRFNTPEKPYGPEDLRYEASFVSMDEKTGFVTVHVKPNVDSLYYAVGAVPSGEPEKVAFQKDQILRTFKDRWNGGAPKPIEECGYKGENDATGIFAPEYGRDYDLIVFGIWIGQDNKYHSTEYTHIVEKAFRTSEYFQAEFGETRIIDITDDAGTRKGVEIDVTVKPASSSTYYFIEAIPAAEFTLEKMEEHKQAMSKYICDEGNRLEGEKYVTDVMKRLCYRGTQTIALGERNGITKPNTTYTMFIYRFDRNGEALEYSTTILESAFTTPAF